MRVVLVGADFEENLGIGMIAAVAQGAGHTVTIVPFDHDTDAPRVVERALAARPDVIGLGIQFQHRAAEFLDLAARLRTAGFGGHLTAGGQFPSLAWQPTLEGGHGLDSIVLFEGEHAFVALLDALAAGTALADVPGLAVRDARGRAVRTRSRPLVPDLDTLPFPTRYRAHARHCGIPFIPIMGSRGCWGACSYCSITSFYRDARAHGGGKTLRHRSPENVAAEMAALARACGPSLFCFHDDNFLFPRPESSLARVRAIRAELDRLGVGKVGMIGKCRPDSMTPELARALRALGVIRLYVGVENASDAGSTHLNRRTQTLAVREALRACREAGIFVCYNLLVFEPDATIADVRENVAFMREMAAHPVNFCRAEPYYGTPLARMLEGRGAAEGTYLGFNYRIEDDRTELLFRIAAAAFRQRNFDSAGVANRNMGLGYSAKILEHFYGDPDGARARLSERAQKLTTAISLETAAFLERAIDVAESVDLRDEDRVSRETARLGLAVAAADRRRHEELDALYRDMDAYGADGQRSAAHRWAKSAARTAERALKHVALGLTLASASSGCESCGDGMMPVDPPPPPITAPPPDPVPPPFTPPPPDPVPPPFVMPVDPPPPPMPHDPAPRPLPPDPVPPPIVPGLGGPALPPAPPDPGRATPPGAPAPPSPLLAPPTDPVPPPRPPPPRPPPPPDPVPRPLPPPPPPPVDPPPPPIPPHDPVPPPRGALGPMHRSLELIDQWRDTTTRRVERTSDLPLAVPPVVALSASRLPDGRLRVSVSAPPGASVRWESGGERPAETGQPASDVEGGGLEVVWSPLDAADQIRVAVRTETGVAVAALRAADLG